MAIANYTIFLWDKRRKDSTQRKYAMQAKRDERNERKIGVY